ncbi:MAG: cytochrome c peroxidase [Planctomycetota bacterium]|nr:cytochrome c peroxidase [Planctomycetota bacterium]
MVNRLFRVIALVLPLMLVPSLIISVADLAAQGPPPPPPPPGGNGPIPPLPPVPQTPENPITAEKALLGKFLFWDSQLSSNSAIACGSCHEPAAGGSDPRTLSELSRHPGADGAFGTDDDILGSLGVQRQDCFGELISDNFFQWERQVTSRKSPSVIGSMFDPRLFWDGRVGPVFENPETGQVSIPGNSPSPAAGALEAQAIGPIISSIEMGCETRTWDDVRARLMAAIPLQYTTDLPQEMADALIQFPNYESLFQMAFGTPDITGERIAFAIATYERTLLPDQTPLDAFIAGDSSALTQAQINGMNVFLNNCLPCHGGPFLSNGNFHDIGVRPENEDVGRFEVTGNPNDIGRFKTPPLRNVELRAPYFHNGGKMTLEEVVEFYNDGGDFQNPEQGPQTPPLNLPPGARNDLVEFMHALTDERVRNGLAPFDHPQLPPDFRRGDSNRDGNVDISDVVHSLQHLFEGGESLCQDAVDMNDDGALNIADPIRLLDRLFGSGEPLPAPSDLTEGPDLTHDLLTCLE